MKSLLRTALAAVIGTHLVFAQAPVITINSVPASLTLSVTNAGGLAQINVATFGFYVDGVDYTAAFVVFVTSGSPLVTITTTATNITIVIAVNMTAYKLAAHVCNTSTLCANVGCRYEGFDNTAQLDATFFPTFGQPTRWNDPSAPGQLAGRAISGSPTATTPAGLGTRIQLIVDPQPPNTTPAGLFSPFDAALANSGGLCPSMPTGCNLGVNPNGGSHIMHLYESVELGFIEDSLEQIEWSPVSGVTAATVYPLYKIWCGVSQVPAPMAGNPQPGLFTIFDSNYDLAPYQTGTLIGPACANPTVPTGARKVACGGPSPYTVALATTQFYPFPTLTPCFDFSTVTGASGSGVNLIFEQDISPGNQVPNFNRYRATSVTPVRRLIDAPLSMNPPGICPFNHGGTFDIYRTRFTFVGLVAQGRSLWYDTGTVNPNYLSFIPSPAPATQPAGTQSTWILEGTDASNPGPATTGASGIYINANGTVFPNVLSSTISQLRYFRFRTELRANNLANTTPSYDQAVMVYSF
jgi:hypothetical protein